MNRFFVFPVVLVLLSSCSADNSYLQQADAYLKQNPQVWQSAAQTVTQGALTQQDIAMGLQEALRVGSGTVAGNLGRANGFYTDPAIRIPLSPELARAKQVMSVFGYDDLANDVELKMNRAAEASMPIVKDVLWQTIQSLTFDDVMGIYNGPNDAATRLFESRATSTLALRIEPIVNQKLREVGAIDAYDAMIGRYKNLPMVPDVVGNLSRYTTEKALGGVFYYLAKEEAAIRQNPAKRTTALLQKVFAKN